MFISTLRPNQVKIDEVFTKRMDKEDLQQENEGKKLSTADPYGDTVYNYKLPQELGH